MHREQGPRRWLWSDLDRDRDRAARDVVRSVRARDAATAGITPSDRVEVEERLTGRGQAAATRRARDRTIAPITDRGGRSDLGIGRVDHRRTFRSGAGPRDRNAHPQVTLPHVRPTVANALPDVGAETGTMGLR